MGAWLRKLDQDETAALAWVDDPKTNPRAKDIFRHAAAMARIREMGLIRTRRRPGWRENVLTKNGKRALLEQFANPTNAEGE